MLGTSEQWVRVPACCSFRAWIIDCRNINSHNRITPSPTHTHSRFSKCFKHIKLVHYCTKSVRSVLLLFLFLRCRKGGKGPSGGLNPPGLASESELSCCSWSRDVGTIHILNGFLSFFFSVFLSTSLCVFMFAVYIMMESCRSVAPIAGPPVLSPKPSCVPVSVLALPPGVCSFVKQKQQGWNWRRA